jgi:hypothetical protein
VGSIALAEWKTLRSQRINDLLDAHSRVGGTGPGRRWRTEQLNWALILRVAAEFQGYCRALHDLAADEFASEATQINLLVPTVIRLRFTEGRRLDVGNARPSSLGSDFGRFGFELWPSLNRRWPGTADGWKRRLEVLNDARNAIAHDDRGKMTKLAAEGYPLSRLKTIRGLRSSVDGLARAMDDVVADHLHKLLGRRGRPW